MINLLGMWLVLGTVTLGWGLLLIGLARRVGRRFTGSLSAFQTLWLGYAGLVALLQLVSFVLPIAMAALLLSLVPAIAGYALERRIVVARARRLALRPRIVAVTACVVLASALVVDYVACDVISWYDTGLYHLQAVQWLTHYGTVTGVGNVHMRFGYNNSVHVFAAYVDAFWEGMAAHVANSFLLATTLAHWFVEIFTARTPRGRLRQVFCLFTLPLLLARLWTLEPSSLSTDLPTALFANVLLLEVISLQLDARERRFLPLLLLAALATVLVTTKLAGLGISGAVILLVLWLVRRDADWRVRATIFALPAVLFVGWLVRGVLTSGWLLYPAGGNLHLSWSVPARIGLDDFQNIKSWSRIPGKPPTDDVFAHGFWHWFKVWLDAFRTTREFILMIASGVLVAWRAAFPSPSNPRTPLWVPVIACTLGIVQWLVGAPDLRYGAFLFWLLAGALLAPSFARAMREPTSRAFVLAMSLVYCVWGGGFAFRVNTATPRLWGRLAAPPRPSVETQSPTGFDQLVPNRGDQCFDMPLPCAPTVGTAKPRTSGSLGDGFVPATP